jgi:hypothetical protein
VYEGVFTLDANTFDVFFSRFENKKAGERGRAFFFEHFDFYLPNTYIL